MMSQQRKEQREEGTGGPQRAGFLPSSHSPYVLGMPVQEQTPSPDSSATPKETMRMKEPNSSEMWKSGPRMEARTWSPALKRLQQGQARELCQ